jgi:orotidine-5'-phosphate decarboxylase
MYDIDNTVELAVKTAARRGFSFVTVHHNETVVRAAVKGRGDYNMKIFTVTVLTSLDDENLKDMGYTNTVKEIIGWRAARALDFGCDGIIAAPSDDLAGIKAMTRERGKDLIIATPGIRPAGSSIDDHQRSGTPSTAIKAGADYLIVGRPIYTSINPSQAALNIIQEMTGAMPSGD